MKKKLTSILLVLTMSYSFGQTLKTFNGPFNDGRSQNGNATYTYYEDPNSHEYLKQGIFKYTFKGQEGYKGFNETITGNFEKGLKNGIWSYIITMTDFGQGNPYTTGTVTLTANYKNGYADGNWKQVRALKNRNLYLVYGQYKWNPFDALKTMSIDMNFKSGYLVGAVNINDEFAKFKASGSYDNNSLCLGTWLINDMNWGKNRELIYKDYTLYEFIARGNNGEVLEGTTKYQENYDNLTKAKVMPPLEREEAGLSIDTVCGKDLCAATNNIKDYFPNMFSNDYFLYEFIGGDLSFKEGFKGGCNINVTQHNYTPLSENNSYNDAEVFFKKNELLRAYEEYTQIDLNNIKPSQKKIVNVRINLIKSQIPEILETYHANSKFFQEYSKAQYDSLEIDKAYFAKTIALHTTEDGTLFTDISGTSHRLNAERNNWIHYNFEKPWEDKNWDIAKDFFEKNIGVYNSIQIAITKQFFNYNNILEKEEKNIKESGYDFNFENVSNSFYQYSKDTFLIHLADCKKEYNFAKSLIPLHLSNEEKINQIKDLNNQNKKEILFSKYQVVCKDFLIQSNSNLQSISDNYNKFNLFLDNLISLYKQNTKEIEKKLKMVETSEQIQVILLNK